MSWNNITPAWLLMDDEIEIFLRSFEHRGAPPYPEDIEKLVSLVRHYREAARAAEEKALSIVTARDQNDGK